VQVAYAIGVARPVSIMVQTFGTGSLPDTQLEKIVDEVFDLTPRGIIDALMLRRPIYRQTASYGHFGRRPTTGVYQNGARDHKVDLFTWERTDRVKDLLSAAR
jgi:S-adenosylmethionine synthetase